MTKAIKRRLRKATSKMLPANKVFLFGLIFLMIFQSIVGPSKSSILVQPVGLAQNKDELKQIQINLSPDLILHLKARHFRPGEIILAQLKSEECFSRSWINFEGQKFPFQREKLADGFLFYGLIGLDGELPSGEFNAQVIIERENKIWEVYKFSLNLEDRVFRLRKLTVDPRYVAPPAELRERIDREAELLRVIFSIITPDWLADGAFIWPNSGPLTAFFGDQRLYNNRKLSFHSGLDIVARQNEPVVASNSGRVVAASNFYFSGKLVIIDHGLGLFTTYHHLEKILVKRGQMVRKGEMIGLVGQTGLSTGPHLHWSVRLGPNRIDPLSLLALSFPSKK